MYLEKISRLVTRRPTWKFIVFELNVTDLTTDRNLFSDQIIQPTYAYICIINHETIKCILH